MNCITVLDFETGKVYQYEVMRQEGWNPDSESIEDFLNSVGHNLSNCEWIAAVVKFKELGGKLLFTAD